MQKKIYIPLVLLAWALLWAGAGRMRVSGEYDVKALFLYNFSKYVTWPGFENDPEFHIGVLGDSPIESPLKVIAGERKVMDKPIVVKTWSTVEEMEACHILFLAKDKKRELEPVLTALEGKPILTVGEMKGYAEAGVVLNFFMKENRVKFQLNRNALERSGLSASSQLMKLAEMVEED